MMMTDKPEFRPDRVDERKDSGGANLANLLMDILYIGKEAVYRRLRGEVPFTFTEAAVISQKLGVSLDQLIGANFGGNALFGLNIVHYADPVETYYAMIDGYAKIFRELKREPESEPGDFVQHHSADALYEVRYVVSFPAVQMDVPA